MIGLLLAGAALAAAWAYVCWIDRRAERSRREMRHITGADEWWGKR